MNNQTAQHDLGQYFTTNPLLKNKVCEFILNSPSIILEPSIGQGDLISHVLDKTPDIAFDMYEIDTTIPLLENIPTSVVYGDFMKQHITKQYSTIIGNPPYVRTKKGNLYIDFTERCYQLLEPNGELIFIVPSDFLKLTSASSLLNDMMENGNITHIFHPHNENMFENASVDVIVFRYCKDPSLEKKVLYNDELRHITNSSGLITFHKNQTSNSVLLKEYFDVYVGLVSGKEEIYKNEELGNIQIINGENKVDHYIHIETYPCENEKINEYLLGHKKSLLERRIRKFNENNWFEWGAPRNIQIMKEHANKECIYIYNLTRNTNVAFVGKVNYFGGALLMLKPKKKYNLNKVVSYLNSNVFKDNFMFSGRFKIGHRQISNSYIPTDSLT